MIYDKIENIELYKGLSEDIYQGLSFLKQTSADITPGVYQITSRVKAIVSEYDTKFVNESGYEAHRANIDIQYPLAGVEKVRIKPIQNLSISKEYDEQNDYLLFNGETLGVEYVIGNGYFLILFPDDGHMPQLCVDEPMSIKKLTLKVTI